MKETREGVKLENHPLDKKADDDAAPVPTIRSPLSSRIRPPVRPPEREDDDDDDGDDDEKPVSARSSIGEIRPRIDPITTNNENQYRAKLAKLVQTFSGDPDAKIALYRLEPERWKGDSIKGFVERWDLNRFKTMEDLLETIEEVHGGKHWELKIQSPNEQGAYVYKGSTRVHIAADPKPKRNKADDTDNGNGKNGSANPTFASPDEKYVKMAIDSAQRKSDSEAQEQSKIFEIVKSQNDSQLRLAEQTLASREREIEFLRKQAEDQRKEAEKRAEDQRKEFEQRMETVMNQARPDATLIQHMSGASLQTVERAAKDASTERERLQSEFSRERQGLIEKYTNERQALIDKMTEERKEIADRFTVERKDLIQRAADEREKYIEERQDLQDELKAMQQQAQQERVQLMEKWTDERRALIETHARDLDHHRTLAAHETEAERKQREQVREISARELESERKASAAREQQLIMQLEAERRGRETDRQQFNMQVDGERKQGQSLIEAERHQRESMLETERRARDQAVENERRQRDSEKIAIEERWKSQMDNQKTLMETNVANLKIQYENQIANLKTQYENTISNQKERLSTTESKMADAERRMKEETDRRLHDAESRPDPIQQMKDTVGVVSEAAGMLGLAKPQPAEPKSDAVSLLEAAHKTGMIDKGVQVLSRVAEVMRPQPQQPVQVFQQPAQQQQQPPMIINVPVNPLTGQPMFPMNPGMVQQPFQQQFQQPQQFAQPTQTPIIRSGVQPAPQPVPIPPPHTIPNIVQQQQARAAEVTPQPPQASPRPQVAQPVQQAVQQQPVQAAPPAPPVELDQETLKGIVGTFDNMLETGVSAKDFAQTIVATQAPEALRPVIQDGVTAFQNMVEQVNPESILLSMRGKTWLRELFTNVEKLLVGK